MKTMACCPALRRLVAVALGLLLSVTAQAQAFRTYLSGTGNDGNPCSLVAPCRLLLAALAAVASGGEIWMLDSANYNTSPVNVSKSVTILAVPGAAGSVVALRGNAINIDTPGVDVALRNLTIVPFPGVLAEHGIFMSAGARLTVDNCVIKHLVGNGIFVNTPATVLVTDTTIQRNGHGLYVQNGGRVTVTRSTFSRNGGAGLMAVGTASSITTADIADSTFSGNATGVLAYAAGMPAQVSVSRSTVVGHVNWGLFAQSNGGLPAMLAASGNVVSNNGRGIAAFSPGSKVWASGNAVSNNVYGFFFEGSGGVIESLGDNVVRNNDIDVSGGALTPIAKM